MILASIIIHQCDNCSEIIAIKTDRDWENFEETWHDGIYYDFCPKCRYLIETQERILKDDNFSFYANSKLEEEKDATNYVH